MLKDHSLALQSCPSCGHRLILFDPMRACRPCLACGKVWSKLWLVNGGPPLVKVSR
ncbi:hypothetical protein LCGC14_1490210 [marine sediment metagenome]|uniref:Uncharacterized protein n=1 Tax=marine sediment metagenome TaxID=412755 RepID=A0A0F9J6Y2_9ZZZZ